MFRTLTDELRRLRLTILSLAAATLVSCGGGDSVAPRPIRFASPVELELAQNSIAMAIGDVTGDGIADVVMTASTPPGIDGPYGLYLFAGRVDGSLAPALLVTGGAIRTCYPSSVAVGDIDGDGRNDVVVGASQCGPQVFPQSETGQLVAGPFVESTGFEALRIVDINGDGRNDVVGVGPGNSSVAWLRQDANGTLVLESPIPLNAAGALDIEAGDVNGDGRPDLVVAIFDYPPQPRIAVLLQLRDGGFSTPQFLSTQPTQSTLRTLAVAVGDLNSDGRNDVVATSGGNSPSTTMAVFYQSNDGKLEAMTSIDTYEVPAAVRIADVNGDGRADVIVEHSGWFTFGVYLQQANAALAAEQRFEAHYGGALSPQVMAVGDVNRDGRSGVLIAGFVLLQRP